MPCRGAAIHLGTRSPLLLEGFDPARAGLSGMPPDLIVCFRGQTTRMPLRGDLTGYVTINLIRGELGARGSKVSEEHAEKHPGQYA